MTVVVDSGVFYAHADRGASRHDTAVAALSAILEGGYGQPYITDYIYDETVTLTLTRTDSHAEAMRVGRRLRGAGDFPELFHLRNLSKAVFETAVDIFERYDDQQLSFTDATTVAFTETHDIDTVLSFDDDFDGIVDRTDPAEVAREHNP
ncbi:type II toxin-antitoxin system VapC family toxin [Halomicroarcula sp. F28]|uniref:type II toxin-antitoxin system VapC family toxin n=1 Tax=Haloarcula salinisoli TaxID=2487746 RepID=UPI001C73B56C|nr:type II toxin-antitoxin system VapC family toxin [Halomicroarcula salinisoli]MBX0287337.1 type II toxin-antitoxin system VapC family toxin [Halomicroarcula salinisoli]